MSDVKRMVFLPLDKKHQNYDESNIVVGELVIDSETGYAWLKVKSGELIPLRGAGYIDLLNYINSTMAIGIEPKDIHSFLLDTANKVPSKNIPTGLLKVRVPIGGNKTEFKEIGIVTDGANCVIYTGESLPDGKPKTTTVTDVYLDYKAFKTATETKLQNHDTRIEAVETEINQRAKDTKLFYDKFTANDAADLVYCINPDSKATKPTEPTNYLFETAMVLGMDNGESVNRHSLGYHMDYKNHRIDKDNAYVRDIGNKVDLSVLFYYKDEKVWIRPTQIDGEFILRDKSPNGGSFVPYTGEVTKMSFSASGLTPGDLITPLNASNNEESVSFTYNQPSHGLPPMSACYFDKTDNKWKLATLENRAKAIVVPIDSNWLTIYSAGHIKVPENAKANLRDEDFVSNEMYYLNQKIDGGFQLEYPEFIYQELGYAYLKYGVMWFAIHIDTPVELMPYTVKNLASKAELSQRQLVVQLATPDIAKLDEPLGTVMTVADDSGEETWHIRKIQATRKDEHSIQTANGLWANIIEVSGKIKEEDMAGKLDKGANFDKYKAEYPDAVAIIEKILNGIGYKTGDRLKTWQELMADLELYVKKEQITQSMRENSVEKIPSANIFNQLLKLVEDIKLGHTGSIVPQENTAVHIQSGILQRTAVTIQSNVDVLYNPVLFIDGQQYDKAYWTFDANTGIITLNEPYDMYTDARWTIFDVFPTDIKYISESVGAIEIAPYAQSLKHDDVVKCLGANSKYDGGYQLRMFVDNNDLRRGGKWGILENQPKVKFRDGWLVELPYTHVKRELDLKLNKERFDVYVKKNSVYTLEDTSTDNIEGIGYVKGTYKLKSENELTLRFNIKVTKDLLVQEPKASDPLKSMQMDYLRFVANLPEGIDKANLLFDQAHISVYDYKEEPDFVDQNEYSFTNSQRQLMERKTRIKKFGFGILYQYVADIRPLIKYDGLETRPTTAGNKNRDGSLEYLNDMSINHDVYMELKGVDRNNVAVGEGRFGTNPMEPKFPNHNAFILLIQRYFEGLAIGFDKHIGEDYYLNVTIKVPMV